MRRTLSEKWVDDDGKLAERRRIRVVNADFKYPRLRLEETVSVDPATREAGMSLVRASVADHVMVALRGGVETEVAVAAIRGLGYPVRDTEAGAFLLVEVPDFLEADAHEVAIAALASLEAFIDHAEPDYLVFPCLTPNDPAFLDGKLWGLSNSGTGANSLASADIDAPGGWQIRRTAADVVVAITDTGIHYDHEDLTANMWTHPEHGHFGLNAYDNNFDPIDLGGHGTHVAGTIGARGNNGTGITGVAWEVQLMALRFLGPNGGTTSDAIRVINDARENGAQIINASWGGRGNSPDPYTQIQTS